MGGLVGGISQELGRENHDRNTLYKKKPYFDEKEKGVSYDYTQY